MSSSVRQIGRNPIFRFGIIGIVLYIILFLIYEPITLGLDVENITILAVPTIVGTFFISIFYGVYRFPQAFFRVWPSRNLMGTYLSSFIPLVLCEAIILL